jgi:serine protease Do
MACSLTAAACVQAQSMPTPGELSRTFSQVAKQIQPCVVKVTSTYKQQPTPRASSRRPLSPDEEGRDPSDLLRRFFGNPDAPQRPFRRQPTGSGVIIDKNGYILTNHHVIEHAERIQVKLQDDPAQYDAKLIGADPEIDLAVLKIDAGKPLSAATIGNSDGVQVGEWAMAIGTPFGLETTVTAGIISAKGRYLGDPQHQLQRFLQTDAAINPGNSGGPLINILGQVIGINSVIATETGGYQGIGFALPINMAARAYNQIIQSGKVSRGAIGIRFNRAAPTELLRAYGATQGVFVTETPGGEPAAQAGLKQGDIITAFNRVPVKDGDDLVGRVAESAVGSQATVTVLRDGKQMDFTVRIADRNQIAGSSVLNREVSPETPNNNPGVPAKFGLSLEELTETARREAGLTEQNGVLIAQVAADSFAEDIGVREDDVITGVNGQPVASIADFKRVQAALKPGDAVAFRVMRKTEARGTPQSGWQALFLAGTLPAE